MKFDYSIIIPHNDIPDLLMRCLNSIPVSEDIQVIVVDDNSADADTYLDRYPELISWIFARNFVSLSAKCFLCEAKNVRICFLY